MDATRSDESNVDDGGQSGKSNAKDYTYAKQPAYLGSRIWDPGRKERHVVLRGVIVRYKISIQSSKEKDKVKEVNVDVNLVREELGLGIRHVRVLLVLGILVLV